MLIRNIRFRTVAGGFMVLIAVALTLVGCGTARLSPTYGQSFDAIIKTQAARPGGPSVPGRDDAELPGRVSQAIYDNYYESVGGEETDSDTFAIIELGD